MDDTRDLLAWVEDMRREHETRLTVGTRVRVDIAECDLIDGWITSDGERLPWNDDDPDGYPADLPFGAARRVTINGCIGHAEAAQGRTGTITAIEDHWTRYGLSRATYDHSYAIGHGVVHHPRIRWHTDPDTDHPITREHRFVIRLDEPLPSGAIRDYCCAAELVPIDDTAERP